MPESSVCKTRQEVLDFIRSDLAARGRNLPSNFSLAALSRIEGQTLEEEYFSRILRNDPTIRRPLDDLLLPVPNGFLNILKEGKAFVAGGSLNSVFSRRPIRDYDIWFRDQASFHWTFNRLRCTEPWSYGQWTESPNARNIAVEGMSYQLIFLNFGSPETIIGGFDFTICMCAYDLEIGCIFEHSQFYEDLHAKRLRYNESSQSASDSLTRVFKYVDRGYEIETGELNKILVRLIRSDGSVEFPRSLLGGY